MEFPDHHHHHHHYRRDEEEERETYAPPQTGANFAAVSFPTPQTYHPEPQFAPRAPPPPYSNEPYPPSSYEPQPHFTAPPPPLSGQVTHVHHNSGETYRPSENRYRGYAAPHLPNPIFESQGGDAAGFSHISHHHSQQAHTSNVSGHRHEENRMPENIAGLAVTPLVRVYCKAEPNYYLTIRDGKVILAPSDDSDEAQTSQAQPRTPIGMELLQPQQQGGLTQEKIARYMSNIPKIKVNPKFAGLPDIREDMRPITTTFRDDEWKDRQAVALMRLSNEEIVDIAKHTLPMMKSGFSKKGVGAIMVLAFQLKDPYSGENVFEETSPFDSLDDVPYGTLSETVLTTVHPLTPMDDPTDKDRAARCYSYIAASLLRLFVKSPENYVMAYNHIINGYKKFYGEDMVLTPNPQEKALTTLSNYFTTSELFKSTLFRLLYKCSVKKKHIGIRNFLFEIHLSNPGLHIVGIFLRLLGVLNCKPELLLAALYTSEYSRQVDALREMLKLISNDSEEYQRQMWKYARIFDDTFMTRLQTRRCPTLTYVLASALKSVEPERNKTILNIRQLADVSVEKRAVLDRIAKKIIRMVTEQSQHWYKFSTRVKDAEGCPCFALVNKATGEAMKHSVGATQPVQLVPYDPDRLDESVLWTESKDLGDGYRTIRMVNNISLNLDAYHGGERSGGVHDGTPIVLSTWNKGDNQRWKIVPF